MKYLFYPGCSIDESALEYKVSTLAVFAALGAEVEEIEGWTCCGASVASVKSRLLGLALPARNLALAEKVEGEADILAICSSCYVNLRRTEVAAEDAATLKTINRVLEVESLTYHGKTRTRHLMDVLANDFSPETIAAHVRRPLTGLTVAPYYGCQTVRPFSPFDDEQYPKSMNAVLEALGATVHNHSHEALCCGTSLMITKPSVGVPMAAAVLAAASPADCVAAVCPMCHMNLDAYQGQAGKVLGQKVSLPILYLPQLMGLAFGLSPDELLLKRHVVSVNPVLARLAAVETETA